MGKERESIVQRLEKAKAEGVLTGQKQSRGMREEEIKRISESLKQYKTECATLRKAVETLESEKEQLEEYNKYFYFQ